MIARAAAVNRVAQIGEHRCMRTIQNIEWHELRHAYGPADDLPNLLNVIENFPAEHDWKSEPWFSLWSNLYHQGSNYSASLAALPHIVSALSQAPSKATLSFFLLPVSIAIADDASPIMVVPQIRADFVESVSQLGKIAAAALPSISDIHVATAAQAAVLVSQGLYRQANDLLEMDGDLSSQTAPG